MSNQSKIKYRKGDILYVKEGVILHGCNAQGVMGSGVALSIRKKYPSVYEDYKQERLYLGKVIKTWVSDELLVLSAVTQEFYGRDGQRYVNYAAIVDAFNTGIAFASAYDYTLHFPKIGAGLGGGDWNIISQLIEDCTYNKSIELICWEM